jgi:hypothetical protein
MLKEIEFQILRNLQVFRPPEYEKVVYIRKYCDVENRSQDSEGFMRF